ncbi:MAG: hypothetical protein LBH90_04800 [Tannerella sp.]|nr:hypothetical protein [Tannerella sp.]
MSWNRAYLEMGPVDEYNGTFTSDLKGIELDAWSHALFHNIGRTRKIVA